MNNNSQSNNGTAPAVVTNGNKRGRKLDPNNTRKIYLVKNGDSYTPRTKGAPAPGSTAYFVNVQRNTKTADFVFNAETMNVQTEIVKARVYTKKVVAVHESANGTVKQTPSEVVVESPAPVNGVAATA